MRTTDNRAQDQSSILCGDNLVLLHQHLADASVDLIYADPPFNSGKAYFGREASGEKHAAYDDRWRFDETEYEQVLMSSPLSLRSSLFALRTLIGDNDALAYCAFLAPRIVEMQRVLKPSGSLYIHSDVRMSHFVRLLLDAVFGREHFHNEIVWGYRTGGAGKKHFSRKHDVILFYSVSKNYTFHPQYERIRYKKPFFSAKQDEQGFYADVIVRDVWEIPAVINVSKDRTGYPTQKPLALLERIVTASSNLNDLMLDPFCGSGTALVAAQKLGRRWMGMEANSDAVAICHKRLATGTSIDR